MRWKSWVGGLALLLAAAAGCKQRCFVTEGQFNDVVNRVPADLAINPNVGALPTVPWVGPPPTLDDLDRKIRYLSVAEAIAISLEQGTVGQPSLLFPGIGLDNLVSFTGNGAGGSDAIRVLSLDPATVGSSIEASLSKFDTIFTSSMTWTNTDQPIATAIQNFQAGGSGLSAIVQTDAQFQSGLLKPLPTGGVAGLTFTVPYQVTNLPARVNPNYRPQLQLQFEQPLLQGFGVEINQLRAAHPGSVLTPGVISAGGPTANGILISRLRFDQQRAEFERNVNQMLLNVETAYWNLYGSYWNLYSRQQAQRFAFESWRIVKAQFDAGSKNIADLGQSRGQYELFRAQRLQALDQVLDNERQLRALMGMPIEDGTRLMPSDAPTLSKFIPDWKTALAETWAKRPELYMARQDIKANQLNLILAKNSLLPDLRFTATYDTNSIGSSLDGATSNALQQLASNHFNDWQLGLRLNVPIGFRAAHSNVRIAKLQLARSYALLQDQELKAERFLGLQYRRLASYYEQIRAQRAQREAYGEQLKARFQDFIAERKTLDILLESQRFWADALANEYAAIVSYNNALCAFEYAKGTILQHDNIMISEGPVPCCAQMRAVEHEKERTQHAILLRERAAPMGIQTQPVPPIVPGVVPAGEATQGSLVGMWQDKEMSQDWGELSNGRRPYLNGTGAPAAPPAEELPSPRPVPPAGTGTGPMGASSAPQPPVWPGAQPANLSATTNFGALRPTNALPAGVSPIGTPLPALGTPQGPSTPFLAPPN